VEIQARLRDFKYCTCNLLAKKQPSFFGHDKCETTTVGAGVVRGTHSRPLPQNFLMEFVKISQVTFVVPRGIRTWPATPPAYSSLLLPARLPLAGLSAVSM